MRELETSLQQFGEFLLKARLVAALLLPHRVQLRRLDAAVLRLLF